jgi:hypothetical protein
MSFPNHSLARSISARNIPEINTPATALKTSRVKEYITASPVISTANSTTANHHAQRWRLSSPKAAAHVATPMPIRTYPAGFPSAWNAAAPRRLSLHMLFTTGFGKRRELPTRIATTVAKKRNPATNGTDFGRSDITTLVFNRQCENQQLSHRLEFFFQQLFVMQIGVVTVPRDQLVMGSILHDLPIVQHGNLVGIAHSRDAV